MRGVKLVISDAHEGLKAAIRRTFGAGRHDRRYEKSYPSQSSRDSPQEQEGFEPPVPLADLGRFGPE